MSLCHPSVLGTATRWICHDCRSRMRPGRIPKETFISSSALVQSRLLRRQPRVEGVFPTIQRRRQSERSDDRVNIIRDDLPSRKEGRRSDVAKRFSHLMDHVQSNIFIAGQRLNDLTGYSGIEALKKDIESQGQSWSRMDDCTLLQIFDMTFRGTCTDYPHSSSSSKRSLLDRHKSTLGLTTQSQ